MITEYFTKENIALGGVLILFLWRIIDFFIRMKKKRESEIEKLAFEMAKYQCNDKEDDYNRKSLFSYYLFYLDALEKNMRPFSNSYEIMKDFDDQFNKKIKRLETILEKLTSVENKLSEKHDLTIDDLWDRNVTWKSFRHDFKLLSKRLFHKKKIKYNSLS
jgi:hypothetical protein